MSPVFAPDPTDLPMAPELATLSVLDAALNAAIDILGYQHDLDRLPDREAVLAHGIVSHAIDLRALIRVYADAMIRGVGDDSNDGAG